jgi:hypothetical protein
LAATAVAGTRRMDSPEQIREWAREQADKLPPFTPAEARQLALIARQLDARAADKAA